MMRNPGTEEQRLNGSTPAYQALKAGSAYVEQGYKVAVNLDSEKFFGKHPTKGLVAGRQDTLYTILKAELSCLPAGMLTINLR